MTIIRVITTAIFFTNLWVALDGHAQEVTKAPQEPRTRFLIKSEKELEETAIHKVQPVYPPAAKKSRVDPTVVLMVTIDEEGTVDNADIISGDPLLYEAAWDAAYQWEWEPTIREGNPVKVIGPITLHFQMEGSIPDSGDVERYKKLVLSKPDSAPGYRLLGHAYARSGRYDDAVKTFKKLVELKPDDADSFYDLGKYYGLAGDNDRAIESYYQAIKLNPKHSRSLHAIAQAHTRMERFEEALAVYSELVRLDPKYRSIGKAYEEMGWVLTQLHRESEALDAFLRSVESNPADENVYIRALALFITLKKDDGAVEFAKRVLSEHPNFEKFRFALAEIHLQSGRFRDAIDLYLEALKADPDNEIMYELLGRAYHAHKDYEEAVNAYRKALQLKPGSGSLYSIHLLLADAYMNLKRYPEAVASARDAIQVDPSISRGHLALGSLLEKMHRPSEAETFYLKALEVQPDDPVVLNNVSYFFFDQNKNLDQGMRLIQKALKQQPTNAHYLDTAGYGYFKLSSMKQNVTLQRQLDEIQLRRWFRSMWAIYTTSVSANSSRMKRGVRRSLYPEMKT
ncbi:MAG TPA: TonB family protein [Acidobacteriota bacterium]|jgi:TonB family protein